MGFGATVYTCCRNESELDGCLNEWDNFGLKIENYCLKIFVKICME